MYRTTPIVNEGSHANGQPNVAWLLQFATRSLINGESCVAAIETVFTPTNDAFDRFLQTILLGIVLMI